MKLMEVSYYKNNRKIVSYKEENEDYKIIKSSIGTRHTYKIKVKNKITLISFKLNQKFNFYKDDKILVNGYQSWTDTREFSLHESLHKIRFGRYMTNKYKFDAYGDYTFRKTHRHVLHGYTYSYLRRKDNIYFYGSYNVNNAYLVINYVTRRNLIVLESDCEGVNVNDEFTLLDYCFLEGNLLETQELYFKTLGTCLKEKLRGYTSWYNHYQDINEDKINLALVGIDSDNYDLFQIDDGFETKVGDWLNIDKNKFPHGLEGIVKKIHDKNLLAGIWLAPFVVEQESEIYKKHPDWVYVDKNNKPVYAGGNWSHQLSLDIRKQEVLDYIKKCLEYYISLGFDFFKLDFLYAVNLVRVEGKSRSQVMQEMMIFLRNILKDKLILGCGVPLENAFNNVDYCRVGCDVSLKFDDEFYMVLAHRERNSTKHTLLDTIYRYPMDKFVFRNDPDVYLLRDDNIFLNEKQKEALIKINHLCGALYLTSDNVSSYTEEKKKILLEAQNLSKATITNIITNKDSVTITYVLDGTRGELVYDPKKGELING